MGAYLSFGSLNADNFGDDTANTFEGIQSYTYE